jgi:hypothetical protein
MTPAVTYRKLEALKQPERQQRLDHEAAAMWGMMPGVQPKAATMLARIPRERPAASV